MPSSIHLVVMGVAGSGKSTFAHYLSEEFGLRLAEGDDFHPAGNIAKMSRGEPLTDEDRWPWLAALAEWTVAQRASGVSTVLTCSALRRAYRDALSAGVPETFFLHLVGSEEVLRARMEAREHFMPPSLLRSQFETLDALQPDERGATLDVTSPVGEATEHAAALVRRGM